MNETKYREHICYEYIMKLKAAVNKNRGRGEKYTVGDFLTLSPGNDPFYAGSSAGIRWGRWFADQWMTHKGHMPTVHVRSLHYALIRFTNTDSPIIMPDGKVYENTLKCWKKLEMAGKYARNNQYIDAERFEDRRAQSLYERVYADPSIFVGTTRPDIEFEFPSFPDRPEYTLAYKNKQRYRLEIWCEKSTQETILTPVADKYQVTMLSAQGELSISAMLKAIARADKSQMPTRILYISDFDPAGRSMPVAASRKLEFWQHIKGSTADIELYPIALTHDQCVEYELERTPIKDSEKRKAKFEARYGGGATELDALEAKHPGALADLLEQEILRYWDVSLDERTEDKKAWLSEHLSNTQDRVHRYYEDEYDELYEEYESLKKEYEQWVTRRCRPFQERLDVVWKKMVVDLNKEMPDLKRYALPSAKIVPTGADCLYKSDRDYFDQLDAYKAFTGKFADLIEDEEEEEE